MAGPTVWEPLPSIDALLADRQAGIPLLRGDDFGLELIVDLHGCDLSIITSATKLAEYATGLCKTIDMKMYGPTLTPYFGTHSPVAAGHSLVQLIETSNLTGHFSDLKRTAYLNILSCKEFDPNLAAEYAAAFFGSRRGRIGVFLRE